MKVVNIKSGFSAVFIFVLALSFTAVAKAQDKPARDEKIVFKTLTLKKTGVLRGRDFHDFTFTAKAGHNLTLTLTSKQNVNFNLLDKKTMLLLETDPSPMQVQDWAGALPKTGDYVIRIFILPRMGPKNRTAAYRLALALSNPPNAQVSKSSDIKITANHICEPNVELRAHFLQNGNARLRFETQDYTLEQTLSGSGARYENKRDAIFFG